VKLVLADGGAGSGVGSDDSIQQDVLTRRVRRPAALTS
jgi:hypothetical protein